MQNRLKPIRSWTAPQSRHYLRREDVRVLLERLPARLYARLNEVRFVDASPPLQRLGYVDAKGQAICMCALPEDVDLTPFLEGRSPRLFGSLPGCGWPERAVRRFLLYDVFLRLLAHAQFDPLEERPESRLPTRPTDARDFAAQWRTRLWADSPSKAGLDEAHRPPTSQELESLGYEKLPREHCPELVSL